MTTTEEKELNFSFHQPPQVFIGREKELGEILANLQEEKNIFIFGPEGIGKKTLALNCALKFAEIKGNGLNSFLENPVFCINFEKYIKYKKLPDLLKKKDLIFVQSKIIVINLPDLSEGVLKKSDSDMNKFKNWIELLLSQFTRQAKLHFIPLIITCTEQTNLVNYLEDNFFQIKLGELPLVDFKQIFPKDFVSLQEEEYNSLYILYRLTTGNLELISILLTNFTLQQQMGEQYLELQKMHKALLNRISITKDEELTTDLKGMTELANDIFKTINRIPKRIKYYLENKNNMGAFQLMLEILLQGTRRKDQVLLNYFILVYFSLGIEYLNRRSYKRALAVHQRVKFYAKLKEFEQIIPFILLMMGHEYKSLGSLYRSRLAYKDALRLFQKFKNDPNIAEASASLAALEILQGRTTDARAHLTLARKYFEGKEKSKAIENMDDLFEAADYVDGAQMVQGRFNGGLNATK